MNLSGEGLDLGLTTRHSTCVSTITSTKLAGHLHALRLHGELVQWVRVFAVKPDNLTLTHGSHVVKGEDWLLQAVL